MIVGYDGRSGVSQAEEETDENEDSWRRGWGIGVAWDGGKVDPAMEMSHEERKKGKRGEKRRKEERRGGGGILMQSPTHVVSCVLILFFSFVFSLSLSLSPGMDMPIPPSITPQHPTPFPVSPSVCMI